MLVQKPIYNKLSFFLAHKGLPATPRVSFQEVLFSLDWQSYQSQFLSPPYATAPRGFPLYPSVLRSSWLPAGMFCALVTKPWMLGLHSLKAPFPPACSHWNLATQQDPTTSVGFGSGLTTTQTQL